MYHSIIFGDKNTYTDWNLVPLQRPVFNPPTVKTTIIDIPGGDGSLDLSQSLTKYPIYNNRTGSFEFAVLNDKRNWSDLYSEIMGYLHGRRMKAVLEDDKSYFYEGRFDVQEWKSPANGTWSSIVINYDVGPYKLSSRLSTDPWLWDPFNFNSDMIQNSTFANIAVDTSDSDENDWVERDVTGLVGRRPVVPEFIITISKGNKMTVDLYNKDLGINYGDVEQDFTSGTYTAYDFILGDITPESSVKMRFRGHGTISVAFRTGRL